MPMCIVVGSAPASVALADPRDAVAKAAKKRKSGTSGSR
jgi:hypothetical protein